MTKRSRFKTEYIYRILAIALKEKKRITNARIAKELGVSESTIRNWRAFHLEFDKVFLEAADCLRVMVNDAQIHAVRMRKRKIINEGPDGKTTTIEEIPPNQIASVASLVLKSGLGYSVKSDDGKDDLLRNTVKLKIAGEISALEAAQLLESEGIAVPKTLMLEVQKSLGIVESDITQPAVIQIVSPGIQREKSDSSD
jgi:predicted transcriptional regulator